MQSALSCLYPLEAGSIRLDGVDLQSLRLAAVRKAICAVPQDPVLFSGTLRSNLYSEGAEGAAPDSDRLWCARRRWQSSRQSSHSTFGLMTTLFCPQAAARERGFGGARAAVA